MKARLITIALLLSVCVAGYAQTPEYAFRVYFTDKNATTFLLTAPQQFLSQRAIQRRVKYNIPIDSSDLPVCSSYIDSVLLLTEGTFHCRSKWQNTMVVTLTDTSKMALLAHLPFFKKDKLVAIYPLGLPKPQHRRLSAAAKPTGFNASDYGEAWAQISLCHGEYLHQIGQTGTGVLISLIDAGFNGIYNSPEFDSVFNSGRLIDKWNFVDDTSVLSSNDGSHGTEVFSCIAGNNPGTFIGTAPDATFALYTSEDIHSEQPIEEDNWVAAAERADSLGTDVITTSLGYDNFDAPFPNEVYSDYDGKTTFVAKGANDAASKGILVVASAGNEGTTAWHYLLTPADADSALTVGAVDSDNVIFPASSFGPNAAGQIKPDVVAMGVQNAIINASGNIVHGSGTSFAAPVIAGLSACLMEANPMATPSQIKNAIRASADNYTNPESQRGYGLPNFAQAYQTVASIRQFAGEKPSNNLIIFPNPAPSHLLHLILKTHNPKPQLLILRNTKGQIVQSKQVPQYSSTGNYTLNISQLLPGLYFLSAISNKVVYHGTFIKL